MAEQEPPNTSGGLAAAAGQAADAGQEARTELPFAADDKSDEEVLAGIAAMDKPPFSLEDAQGALRVMTVLAQQHELLKEEPMKPLRARVFNIFHALNARDLQKRWEKAEVARKRAQDKAIRDHSQLRAGRRKHLAALQDEQGEGVGQLLMLDGAVDDDEAPAQAAPKEEEAAVVAAAGAATAEGEAAAGKPRLLLKPRACYACHRRFREMHPFYDALCEVCAPLNFAKRKQTCDLSGRIALVTGGRVKIGFQIVLKLLRAGAHVIVTTRFPVDAAKRYAELPDYESFRERLDVYGLDFRNLRGLEEFCEFLCDNYTHLDVIVNNACQTIRRPRAYYAHMLPDEQSPPPALMDKAAPVLARHHAFSQQLMLEGPALQPGEPAPMEAGPLGTAERAAGAAADGVEVDDVDDAHPALAHSADGHVAVGGVQAAGAAGVAAIPAAQASSRDTVVAVSGEVGASAAAASAVMTQLQVVKEDEMEEGDAALPTGVLDVNKQQVDLRTHNSWMTRLHEVQTGEAAEVLAINSMAPFVITSKLKPLMLRDPPVDSPSYVSDQALETLDRFPTFDEEGSIARVPRSKEVLGPYLDQVSKQVRQERRRERRAAQRRQQTAAAAGLEGEADAAAAGGEAAVPAPVLATEAVDARSLSKRRLKELRQRRAKEHYGCHGETCHRPDRFIVQVSAMEGKFYRKKSVCHPHTNMAKAALNMMVRTSAEDYAADGIYMNAADTGWINPEQPVAIAQRISKDNEWQTPLDEIDAAARVLDPVFAPLVAQQGGDGNPVPLFGKFFKDYKESEW